jgi:cytochrome c-type biogenesis protein CcmE
VLALSVAAVLAVFLLYFAVAGGATPSVQPGELAGKTGTVSLAGVALGPVRGDSFAPRGKRFRLRDVNGTSTVRVVYRGTVPELFKPGRHILVRGELRNGVFVAERDSMVTKCPSKYVPKGSSS